MGIDVEIADFNIIILHKMFQNMFMKNIYKAGLVVATALISLASCAKKDKTEGTSQFIGIWRGHNICQTVDSAYTIKQGPNNYSLYMTCRLAKPGVLLDTCATSVDVLGTVTNSTDGSNTFSIAPQTFIDMCGNSFTISGSGQLYGDSIIINTLTNSTRHGSINCTFKGGK